MKKTILFCGTLAMASILLSFTLSDKKKESKVTVKPISVTPAKKTASTSGPFILEPMTQF
jgi:hypothetical protein